MGMISGGQLAVDALIEKGVRKVFSLSGGQRPAGPGLPGNSHRYMER